MVNRILLQAGRGVYGQVVGAGAVKGAGSRSDNGGTLRGWPGEWVGLPQAHRRKARWNEWGRSPHPSACNSHQEQSIEERTYK